MSDVPKAVVVSTHECPSVHIWSGQRCIRERGHDGVCWGKSQRCSRGAITRAEWVSIDGQFKSHHQYDTKYPTNAHRG